MISNIKLLLMVFIIFKVSTIFSQKHDNIWCLGYNDTGPKDTTRFGGQIIDFSGINAIAQYSERELNMNATSGSICDELGQLMFYTNGCEVYSHNNQLMQNGDKMAIEHEFTQTYCKNGYPFENGILILPIPEMQNKYIIIHQDIKFQLPSPYYFSDTLYASYIDMTLNNGLGAIYDKRVPLINDTLHLGGFTATRHANGIDWWMVFNKYRSNKYYKLLLTSEGIINFGQQEIGEPVAVPKYNMVTKFSQNGKKIIRFSPTYGLQIMDFDRSTGEISNAIFTPFWINPITDGASGVETSISSKYLYLSIPDKLYQLNLESENVFDSRILIDTFDGFKDPLSNRFFLMQMAPNGKIYMSCTNSSKFLHVIHNPEEFGDGCIFKQHNFSLATLNAFTMPYFPNFRLGAGSDSTINENEDQSLSFYPNPTSGIVYIDNYEKLSRIEAISIDGKVKLFEPSSFINIENFSPGIVILKAFKKNGTVGVGKVVLIR